MIWCDMCTSRIHGQVFSLRMKSRPINPHYVSSVGSVFSLFNMDASSGLSLSLETNSPVLGSILFRSRGPEMAIARAPMGAVIMIESTAVVSTLVPHSIISALPSLMAASKASPPMAACSKKKNKFLYKEQYTIYVKLLWTNFYSWWLYFTKTWDKLGLSH